MKKIIVLLISTVLLLSLLVGCDIGADKPNPASDFEYEISESKTGVIIYKYIGTSENGRANRTCGLRPIMKSSPAEPAIPCGPAA